MFDKFHPIEIDPNISKQEKKKKMDEWWRLHNAELLKHGLNKDHLSKVVKSSNIVFRQGVLDLLDILKENNIPLIIMSSSGLGNFTITKLLEKQNRMYDNIQIISNRMELHTIYVFFD